MIVHGVGGGGGGRDLRAKFCKIYQKLLRGGLNSGLRSTAMTNYKETKNFSVAQPQAQGCHIFI